MIRRIRPLTMRVSIRALLSESSGATIILVAVMLPLLLAVMAVTVDIARLYVVRTKAQTALDNALLGAVASETSLNNIRTEARNLFPVNFPSGYLGSTVGSLEVTQAATDVYNGAVTVRLPTSILNLAGRKQTTFNLTAQVTRGYTNAGNAKLELALVLDYSKNLDLLDRVMLRSGLNDMICELFPSISLPNVYVSIVHYNVSVNVGRDRLSWVQPDSQLAYLLYSLLGVGGFMSNRNSDSPRNGFADVDNTPPTNANYRFRLPQDAATYTSGHDRIATPSPPEIAFALNNRTQILNQLPLLLPTPPSEDLRMNVGLMWGWFTLSPGWQGVWSSSKPTLPAGFGSGFSKKLVLVTGGKNKVFLGTNGTSNDDVTTGQLCAAIKAQGIRLFVVALGKNPNQVNEPLLTSCASRFEDYFFVRNSRDMQNAFKAITQELHNDTIRLTQ